MQHFQSILIVVGLLAIGGVLIHGYLLNRKEKIALSDKPNNVDLFSEKSSPVLDAVPTDDILTDGIISDVRIISHEVENDAENIDFSHAVNDEKIDPITFTESNDDVLLDSDNVSSLYPETITEESSSEHLTDVETNSNDGVKQEEVVQAQDLFIFNVVAKEDILLGGHELLQFFLTSGFRFGEMSIFHRHLHSDGKGPVLFSIANMMAPGVFDPENMEQFKSEGVSFFLTAPNKHIDIKESFELMLRAVEQMAEEFDCIVLNAGREPMTQEQFIEYNHRLLHHI